MDVRLVLLILGLLLLLDTPVEADYIWHYDEIPYESKARCRRATSYYSNSVTANDTDIDVASDLESLLDYNNKETCFFCVCSVDGKHASCISRQPWFCEYYRVVRDPNAPRNRYHKLFQQNRPGYFRQLSYRLRRTMDDGIYSFYAAVGEDLLNNTCVPFVSEYSDCTEANYCSGCNRCHCTAEGEWACEEMINCPLDDEEPTDQDTIVTALTDMQSFIEMKKKQKQPRTIVPPPPNPKDELIVSEHYPREENFESWFTRQKRSLKDDSGKRSKGNTTVRFFHTVDEINEDTLKNLNKTGTITAQKIQINQKPKISRRTMLSDNYNKTAMSSLHIEYNQPQDYDPHITENKIATPSRLTNKIDEKELQKLIGNYSQDAKDKNLSKLVVNELKIGDETIGDKNVLPISNITFKPENDTLTAMAFIAGNLLSKLWEMEKDVGDDSIETEVLKHEKINDLLEIFKEPLTIRQETFLKNALEKISESLNKNKSAKNISICQTLDSFQDSDEKDDTNSTRGIENIKTKCQSAAQMKKTVDNDNQFNITVNVVSKLNNVLGLVKKFESVQRNLKNVRHNSDIEQNTKYINDLNHNASFELFGTLLDKITKLLIPNRSKSKRVSNKLKNSYQFANKANLSNIFDNKFNINPGQINMTTKDKLLLDYLNHIENNPNCLFKSNKQRNNGNMNIEGNILYNLSEFFKIKSFVDLMKLTNPQINDETIKPTSSVPNENTSSSSFLRTSTPVHVKLATSSKEKLRAHLKAVIEDLQQLQKEHSIYNSKNNHVMDALPCIYKILNDDSLLNGQSLQSLEIAEAKHLEKLENLVDTLKTELQANLPTRRNNNILVPQETTKAIKIWERIIKNIKRNPKNTRRSFNSRQPKTFEELKDIIEKVELMGNSYKNFALVSEIPPHKRLILLKALEAETKQQSFALANIKKYIDTVQDIPFENNNEIKEFIENVGNNMKLSAKVIESDHKFKQNVKNKFTVKTSFNKVNKQAFRLPKPLNLHKGGLEYKNTKIKLSRDQILNQLIMNRVSLYLKSKEASGAELNDDINYNIGKRILFVIRSGNVNVAKELFRIFIANKQKEEKQSQIQDSTMSVNYIGKRAPFLTPLYEPTATVRFGPEKNMDMQIGEDIFKPL